MKKIIFVLISAFAIFCCTLLFVDEYITDKYTSAAKKHNTQLLKDLARNFDVDLNMASNSAESFLSGMFYCKEDSIDGQHYHKFYVQENDIPHFNSFIEEGMRDFLNSNPKITRAMFLVDDSVSMANLKYGFTDDFSWSLAQTDSSAKKITDYDFMKTESYNRVKREGKSLWVLPSIIAKMKEKLIIQYVPIYCENGGFFGVFAINKDISSVRNDLVEHLPYGKTESEITIVDQKGRIVLSYPEIYEQYDSIRTMANEVVNDNYVERIDSLGSNIYTYYEGERWLLEKIPIPAANWTIYSTNKEKAIFKDVYRMRFIIFSVSLLGMLLMLLCCLVIFRQVGSDMKEKAFVENEIKLAAEAQRSILSAPSFSYRDAQVEALLRPAYIAGGDLYSYLVRDDKLVFCLGDVSGKGMPAALFMTQVHSLFHDAVRHSLSPEQIMMEINDVLAENNPSMTFCTLIVGVLCGNELTLCNAGHNRPVLIKKGEEPSYLALRPNLAVGLMEGFKYCNESLQLNPEDTLLLYTDGVTEAMNQKHEEFGDKRLLEALSGKSQDFIKVTTSEVEKFVGDYEQSDDITLLCITHTADK